MCYLNSVPVMQYLLQQKSADFGLLLEKLQALDLKADIALTKPLATNVEFSLLPLLACTALAIDHFFGC